MKKQTAPPTATLTATTTPSSSSSSSIAMMPSPTDCSMCGRVGFAVLGILLGVCSAMVFAAEYHNVHVTLWAFLSAAVAAFTLYVHAKHARGDDVKSTSQLHTFMYLGCLAQLAGICCGLVYGAVALYQHQGFMLHGRGYVAAAIWCLLTVAWGFQLFYFSRAYRRQHSGEAEPLIPPEERPVMKKDIVFCSIQCLE